MSVWVLHQTLTPDEELYLRARKELALPFDGLPDLSALSGPEECRRMLQLLYPDEPPEALARRFETLWRNYAELHIEDILVVPLPGRKEMALAEVTGPYRYEAGRHWIPVTWYDKPIILRTFGKHKELFERGNQPMYEIQNPQARIAIRDHLPHSYNRFAAWKWVFTAIFIVAEVAYLMRLLE